MVDYAAPPQAAVVVRRAESIVANDQQWAEASNRVHSPHRNGRRRIVPLRHSPTRTMPTNQVGPPERNGHDAARSHFGAAVRTGLRVSVYDSRSDTHPLVGPETATGAKARSSLVSKATRPSRYRSHPVLSLFCSTKRATGTVSGYVLRVVRFRFF